MSLTLWVEQPDGSKVQKPANQVSDEDLVLIDGPGAFAAPDAARMRLDAEIEGAGGLDAWRSAAPGRR